MPPLSHVFFTTQRPACAPALVVARLNTDAATEKTLMPRAREKPIHLEAAG